MQLQVLETRYVDLQRLVNLLNTAFGAGNFEVKTENRGDSVVLTVPRELTDEEIAQVRTDS